MKDQLTETYILLYCSLPGTLNMLEFSQNSFFWQLQMQQFFLYNPQEFMCLGRTYIFN